MINYQELNQEINWLREILEGPCLLRASSPGGRICQFCGETALYDNDRELVAGYSSGSGFLGFSRGHYECHSVPNSSYMRRRPWRYCELCRHDCQIDEAKEINRCWVCASCDGYLDLAPSDKEVILLELAQRRYLFRKEIESEIKEYEPAYEPPEALLRRIFEDQPKHQVVLDYLPDGLYQCSECLEIAGSTWTPRNIYPKTDSLTSLPEAIGVEIVEKKSTCLCEGIVCRKCELGKKRRPISAYYDPESGWWSVPYFTGFSPCHSCSNSE
jgi:hypothetical protein